jgi:2-octaprenyl-3-methyl-6-methoxy-1,4-benzoquinol hydroxylase
MQTEKTPMPEADYDVLVVGGGMVGSMLAAALAQSGNLHVAVLEQSEPVAFEPGSRPEYDMRVSALSIATQRMLENVDAWQGVVSRRACPYREMLVWDGEEGGRTHFKSSEIGATELGHIVENRVLQLALLDRIKTAPSVDYICPAQLESVRHLSDRVVCTVKSESSLRATLDTVSARLLVGADGARSKVRELASIRCKKHMYPQQALVATVETELPQQEITWQRFMPTGPQAFLPLCGSRASMVWYHTAEEVERLKNSDDEMFRIAMQENFPDELGGIRNVLMRGSFPIARAHAETYITERIALIGDAAHTVHPLAGQGVNLGMLDAAALADVVSHASKAGRNIGSMRTLRRYERWRKGDNAMMISILDGFYHAFKPQPKPVREIRSRALSFADQAGLLKRQVMRAAMGLGSDLPKLAR